MEVCGDVSGLLDAHGVCRTYSALRGQSERLLLWRCQQVTYSHFLFPYFGFVSFSILRLALELGLNRDSKVQPLDERHERELLNRRRTWMICSIMDGSTSLETGKAPGVGKDEEVCRFF